MLVNFESIIEISSKEINLRCMYIIVQHTKWIFSHKEDILSCIISSKYNHIPQTTITRIELLYYFCVIMQEHDLLFLSIINNLS